MHLSQHAKPLTDDCTSPGHDADRVSVLAECDIVLADLHAPVLRTKVDRDILELVAGYARRPKRADVAVRGRPRCDEQDQQYDYWAVKPRQDLSSPTARVRSIELTHPRQLQEGGDPLTAADEVDGQTVQRKRNPTSAKFLDIRAIDAHDWK